MTALDEFLQSVSQRPLPRNPVARIRTLAKELAEGAAAELWAVQFFTQGFPGLPGHEDDTLYLPQPEFIRQYLYQRWGSYGAFPDLSLLERMGYLTLLGGDRFSNTYSLTQAAFALVETVEPSTIFISYKRSESSAFALLLVARLKEAGLQPFLDMALIPGEDWRAGLQERVQSQDYFIVLLGNDTLRSEVTRHEIAWAVEAEKVIIPIWHNGFVYQPGGWDVSPEIDQVLTHTHTIRVVEENPLAYNNAIVELLNRFGYTP